MRPLLRAIVVLLVCAYLSVSPQVAQTVGTMRFQAAPAAGSQAFLPLLRGQPSPAGTYGCDEFEFGLIWTTEVITLSVDGSSVYQYNPPASAVVTGTWVYTPTAQEIGFTGFRWLTATVELPNHLSARKYLPGPGFDVALSCTRRTG